jgi:cytidylate kinase
VGSVSKTEQLLNRQFTRWDLDRKILERFAKDEKVERTPLPVITVSRELGSGGMFASKLVANELKFAYYDREIIEQVAAEAGSSEKHVAQREAGPPDAVGGMLLNLLDHRHLTDTAYLHSLVRVLRRIGEEGHVLILGRGGCHVLPHSLRVRTVAPFELRVERIALIRNLTAREARHTVLEYDHGQRRFRRMYFGSSPNDPLFYDLIINTEHCALEHAAAMIVQRARQIWPKGLEA